MTKLNSITLNNIRRFSENVEIQIEDGVTIFLAPNGTGKTAIFEAIEFALTKKIRRFNDEKDNYDFSPVIRNEFDNASINLDFGDGKKYDVFLEVGEKPSFKGNLSEFYGKTPEDDIPYIFHMTRLLNQSQKDWFVQANKKDAGTLLGYLPIGNDVKVVHNKMVKAKAASKRLLKDIEEGCQEIKYKYDRWLELIKKRDEQLDNRETPLIPLEQLFRNIKEIVEPDVIVSETFSPKIEIVKAVLARVFPTIEQLRQETANKKTKILAIQSIPDDYHNLQKQLSDKNNNLSLASSKKLEIEKQLNQQSQNITFEENNEKKNRNKLSALENINNKSKQYRQLSVKKEQMEAQFIISSERNDNYRKHLIKLQKQLNQSEEIQKNHRELRSHENSIGQDTQTANEMLKLLESWNINLLAIDQHKKIEEGVNSKIVDLKTRLDIATTKRNDSNVAYQQAIKNFESINAASDLIHDAVMSIAKNLPKDQDDCPVCGVSHGYQELQQKITNALNAMNPALIPAKARMEETEKELSQFKVTVDNITIKLREKNNELKDIRNQISALITTNEYIRQHHFPECGNINEAKLVLEKKNNSLTSRRNDIKQKRLLLQQEPTKQELDTLQFEIKEIKEKLTKEQAIIEETNSSLENLKFQMESLKSDLDEHKQLLENKEIDLLINKNKEEVEKATLAIRELRVTKEGITKNLAAINTEVTIYEKDVRATTQTLNETIEKWKSINSKSKPSVSEYTNLLNSAIKSLSLLEEKKQDLNEISHELSGWESMDRLNSLNKEIDAIREDNSESKYNALLEENIEKKTKKYADIERKHKVLDTLSQKLKKESENILKYVERSDPLRNKLLKKIIVEPLYSVVKTPTKLLYNKPESSTDIILHGNPVSVSKAASEAQMTDLQLTFLLSMAKFRSWSPWKSLLLDDPTQHHDLVHAAGVFDVLRDYVADDGFQILLSTHDSMQANFFKRKLENDGIPVKIWELVATEKGVIAELMY